MFHLFQREVPGVVRVLAPSYTWDQTQSMAFEAATTAVAPGFFRNEFIAETTLVFNSADQVREVPVPIPRLVGMDDVEIERMGFEVASLPRSEEKAVSGQSVSAGALAVNYTPPNPRATVRLTEVHIGRLSVVATDAKSFVVAGDGAGRSAGNVVFRRDAESGDVVGEADANTAGADFLHFLIRPKMPDGGFGPPMAAVPHFEMPGAGGQLYGPALGGGTLSVFRHASGDVRVVLKFHPALTAASIQLLIGTSGSGAQTPHGGLPNEVTGVAWSAESVVAQYDVRPAGLTVTAKTAAGGETPTVARFDADPGDGPADVDFAPVARSLLRSSYPQSTGDDLGFALQFQCDSIGDLGVNLTSTSARYVRSPLGRDSRQILLRGAAEDVTFPIPAGFEPARVSFIIDGRYGPARLIAAADSTPALARSGLRVANSVRVARHMSLTATEQGQPLVRVAAFGRASIPGELLLTLHSGDETRIGPAIGPPLAIGLTPAADPAWHRVEISPAQFLPPQPATLWCVAQVTRGVFWWHCDPDHDSIAQHSADEGGSWSWADGRPFLQFCVAAVDPESGIPIPADPVALTWPDGVLNGDLVGVAESGPLAVDFRRLWIAEGASHAAFLRRIAELGELLTLSFSCRRDVDLSVSEIRLIYNPWQAGAV